MRNGSAISHRTCFKVGDMLLERDKPADALRSLQDCVSAQRLTASERPGFERLGFLLEQVLQAAEVRLVESLHQQFRLGDGLQLRHEALGRMAGALRPGREGKSRSRNPRRG